jgi:hypothetical protein
MKSRSPRAPEIKVRPGSHAALVYDEPAQLAAAVAFLAEGAQRGEKCVMLAYQRLNERVGAQLRDLHGVEARELVAQQKLTFLDGGASGKELLAELRRQFSRSARAAKPARLVVSLAWGEEGWPEESELLWLEAQLDGLCESDAVAGLCLYDVRQTTGHQLLHGALECHQTVLTRGLPHKNPFALPPDAVAREAGARRKAERALQSWLT